MSEPVEPVETTEHIQTDEPEDTVQGAGQVAPKKKSWLARMTPLQRTLLGLAIIAVMVVGAFYAPPEGDAENTSGDPGIVLPVTTTNLIASKTIHRTLQYHGLQMTILDVKLANKFSDDKKPIGKYTLRIEVNVDNKTQAPIGVQYVNLVHLLPTHGDAIRAKYISIKPDAMPGSTQNNCFIDFPLTQSAPISSFILQLDQNTSIPLNS
jgi:hypothetical protein